MEIKAATFSDIRELTLPPRSSISFVISSLDRSSFESNKNTTPFKGGPFTASVTSVLTLTAASDLGLAAGVG